MTAHGTLRAPQQLRSQDTLDRLVAAAERALERDGFDGMRLQDIAEAAGVTVGAFYARFHNKDGLLHHLESRVRAQLESDLAAAFDTARDRSVNEIARDVFMTLARAYERHRGVIRALTIRAQTDTALRRRRFAANQALIDDFVEALTTRRAEIAHPRPAEAVRLGLVMVGATLRELLVFRDFSPSPSPIESTVDDLTALFLAHLKANA